MSKWICGVCGYIYDEEKEGVKFSDLPEGWTCPLCGAGKELFSLQNEKSNVPKKQVKAVIDDDMRELSAGELAAVCSNLARGCEKQYKDEEAALFTELAAFFTSAAPEVPQDDIEGILELIDRDLQEGYPSLSAAAVEAGDRGTQRICVWGEKVTRILQSLLTRYKKEGEDFLKNTQVWVCTVCGFVYIGDEPPQLCPVCKVPAWKFDRIEGRGQ